MPENCDVIAIFYLTKTENRTKGTILVKKR